MNTHLAISFMAILALGSFNALAATKININTATVDEIQDALPYIGPIKAQAIIDYRIVHGAFKSLYDLDQVPGIGAKVLAVMGDMVQFDVAADTSTTSINTSNTTSTTTPPPVTSQ